MITSSTRLAVLVFSAVLIVVGGTSCRTMRGAGQDIQHAGNRLERSAAEHDHR